MPINTFVPAVRPAPGAKIKAAVKLKKANLGDGYTAVAPDGLNHIRDSVDLNWDTLSPAEALALEAFMRNQKGSIPFLFDVDIGTMRKWTCDTWERTGGVVQSFSVTFVESFLPVV